MTFNQTQPFKRRYWRECKLHGEIVSRRAAVAYSLGRKPKVTISTSIKPRSGESKPNERCRRFAALCSQLTQPAADAAGYMLPLLRSYSLRSQPAIASVLVGCLLSILTCTPGFASDSSTESNSDRGSMIVIVGAAGEAKYGDQFSAWAEKLETAAKVQSIRITTIGQKKGKSKPDRDLLQEVLKEESQREEPLWIVMFGHGTFDGKSAKFNLRGPDVSATDFKDWLKDFKRPTAIVNCASASAPFINELSARNRIVISATKSGYEMNATRFGEYFSAGIGDKTADLDKDDQVSLLEAFLFASARTTEFYESDGRLATEHSLIDDNSDGRGTPADWFRGVRVTKQATENGLLPDGPLAHQWHLVPSDYEQTLSTDFLQKRNAIELEIEKLRARKSSMKEVVFYASFEQLMLKLARHYENHR